MYLSRLTAFGFKSFAQKLDLPFKQGITCVVGPNGCGKSNVVDALRWALGEQRARVLRSTIMEDVIFSGSRTRKPLGMAEVSVTIDNSRKLLPVDFSEVTVTRRLFRSGESDYLLNKIPCRLMDIQNLFMDTGIGAHAYSVIESGMVDEIISDKAEERRRIFEEAAGVTRYKLRRRSAWNKLQSIQQDLQRIDDITGEVERQVTSLARQERKARRYKVLMDELEDLEIRLARYRYFAMADRARPMIEEMSFLKEDVEVGNTDVARLEVRLEEIRTELAEQDQALVAANAEVSRQVDAVYRKDREILVAREEIRSIEGFLARAARQQRDLVVRREAAVRGRKTAEQGAVDAAASLQSAEAALEGETARLEAVTEGLDVRRARADEQKAQMIGLLRESSQVGGQLERMRAELEGVVGRRARVEEDAARVEARGQEAGQAGRDAARQMAELERELEARKALKAAHVAGRARQQEARNSLVEARDGLRARIEANSARLALLEKLREGFEGYARGVRALAVNSPFAGRIRGVVADLIDVAPAYVAAVEAALGRALECLVVDTTEDALKAMDYLRSGEYGAAAFLPLERAAQGSGTPWAAPEADGVVGRASDLLRGGRRASGPVRALLRRTLVVRDAGAALAVTPRMRAIGIDIVTLNGEVFASDGTVYGGAAPGEETGLIGRAQQVEALGDEIAADRERLAALEMDIRAVVETLNEQTAQIDADDGALAHLHNRLAGLQRDRQNASVEVERQAQAAAELKEERERLGDREAGLRRSIAEAEAEIEGLEFRRAALEEEARAADEALREQEIQRRAQQDAVSARRVEIASTRERAENLRQEVQRLTEEQTALGKEMDRLAGECEEGEKRKAHLAEIVRTASKELEGLHRAQAEVEQRRDTRAERQQELMMAARGVEEELRGKSRRVSQNRDRLHALEVELAELTARAEALQERMQQGHDVDIKALGRLDDAEFNADISQKRVVEIQERLRRMGSVNLAALEDYEVQKERYEFLARQRDDLLEAEETLKRTITKIDRTARARFLDTYGKIRENFQRTFAAFFEGGEADLSMPPDEDPLEAPIEITARPRGKRLQHINLLSGGERALTAIALLFAIYLVKPSPFCILDEVDAPLDDANVDCFVRVVKKFSEDTQFIVVTHNKRTMEVADVLHGITMEEPGVSKLVTVRLGGGEKGGNGQARVVEEEAAVAPAGDG